MGDQVKAATTELKIGSTTYVVTSSFKQDAKEDVVTKMERIIKNDAKREAENFNFSALT